MPQAFINLIVLIILLPILVTLAWNLWLSYLQTIFLGKIKWVMLEVRPPKDVFKSPLAMELVLNSLYQVGGVGNWFQKYWLGNVRNYFSLEIISTEGSLHFYIRTSDKFRKLIESQIYAQYPQAEVIEVEDYTNRIPDFTKNGPYSVWGSNLVLTKDDPYPIKTYIDYGLDRAVGALAEEERIDPITPTLEFMGSIGGGEHIWMQIIVRGDTPRFSVKNKDGVLESGKKWTDRAKEIIKELNDKLKEKDADNKVSSSRPPTKGEAGLIEAIDRNANKFGFDAGIRLVYISTPERFDANRITGVLGILRQYTATDYNGFKPDGPVGFDFPWQDVFGKKVLLQKEVILSDYKRRKYFYGDFDIANITTYFKHPNTSGKKPFILSTEELATLFHLPGRVAETPTFERIESKKAEAPANLPV